MKEELKSIKEMLFDAPEEVKLAFNQVVEYFSIGKQPSIKSALKILESRKIIDNYYDEYEESKNPKDRGHFVASKDGKNVCIWNGPMMYDVIVFPGQDDDGNFSGIYGGVLNSGICSVKDLDTLVLEVFNKMRKDTRR